MENISKVESKEKLKKVSSGLCKVLRVVKIILIVLSIIAAIEALVFFVLGGTDLITKIYEANESKLANVKLEYDSDKFIFINYNYVYLKDLYAKGDLDKLVLGYGVETIGVAINLCVFAVVCHYIRKVFILFRDNENPFDVSMLKPLKIMFILITILIIIKNVIVGLIVGGLLACLYFIYLYGCCMQEEDDHTL